MKTGWTTRPTRKTRRSRSKSTATTTTTDGATLTVSTTDRRERMNENVDVRKMVDTNDEAAIRRRQRLRKTLRRSRTTLLVSASRHLRRGPGLEARSKSDNPDQEASTGNEFRRPRASTNVDFQPRATTATTTNEARGRRRASKSVNPGQEVSTVKNVPGRGVSTKNDVRPPAASTRSNARNPEETTKSSVRRPEASTENVAHGPEVSTRRRETRGRPRTTQNVDVLKVPIGNVVLDLRVSTKRNRPRMTESVALFPTVAATKTAANDVRVPEAEPPGRRHRLVATDPVQSRGALTSRSRATDGRVPEARWPKAAADVLAASKNAGVQEVEAATKIAVDVVKALLRRRRLHRRQPLLVHRILQAIDSELKSPFELNNLFNFFSASRLLTEAPLSSNFSLVVIAPCVCIDVFY